MATNDKADVDPTQDVKGSTDQDAEPPTSAGREPDTDQLEDESESASHTDPGDQG